MQEQQQIYSSLQQANRQASTQVQQNAAKHLREQRKALLGSPDPSAKQRQLQDSSQLLGASKDITQGLRRTKQLLSQVQALCHSFIQDLHADEQLVGCSSHHANPGRC